MTATILRGAAERIPTLGRVLVWFSCGAASAVAAKISVSRFADTREVQVCYCDTSADEHPDNQRFLTDVQRWIGWRIMRLHHPKYSTVEQVVRGERYLTGPHGPACSRALKRRVREAYQRPNDEHVIGFTADEADRIADFGESSPSLLTHWVLQDAGLTKEDCYHVLTAAGIELPLMYKLGYGHANCIGCIRGGKGYWNKIRRDFPELFAARAKLQREIGVYLRNGSGPWWLDELKPGEGRDVPEPPIECGVFCSQYDSVLRKALAVEGK